MIITICVLAAGESKRFRGEKLLSCYGKKTVSENVLDLINTLKGDDSTQLLKFLITKPKLFEFFNIKTSQEWRVISNENYREGMSTSLKLGILEAIKNKSDYLLLFLADMPKIKKNTVDTVMKQIIQSSGKIIRPVFFGKPGFPVALPRYLFDELTLLTGDVGAKAVIDRHKTCLLNVESSDIGCIFDIDEVIRSNDE